jgi:hypothetical protein
MIFIHDQDGNEKLSKNYLENIMKSRAILSIPYLIVCSKKDSRPSNSDFSGQHVIKYLAENVKKHSASYVLL